MFVNSATKLVPTVYSLTNRGTQQGSFPEPCIPFLFVSYSISLPPSRRRNNKRPEMRLSKTVEEFWNVFPPLEERYIAFGAIY